jgi:hypothetical protein
MWFTQYKSCKLLVHSFTRSKSCALILDVVKQTQICLMRTAHEAIDMPQSKTRMMPKVQKRSEPYRHEPLLEPGILQRVLSFVGPGHWLFLATVSRLWKELYARVAANELSKLSCNDDPEEEEEEEGSLMCAPQMTLYSAVFSSPARVKLAQQCGLDNSTAAYQCSAGMHSSTDTLAAAQELGMNYTHFTMMGAAKGNQLPVLQFLHALGCPLHEAVAAAAAKRGDLKMLRWLREQGCKWDDWYICDYAASSGNIEMAAWVKQEPYMVCDHYAMIAAAAKGHTAMCEYLRAELCPWAAEACEAAARYNHVHTLRWLHQHGCPWVVDDVWDAAAKSGSVDVMLYLQRQGSSVTAELLTQLLNITAVGNKLAAAQWLRQQGAEWPDSLYCWSQDVLTWARFEGCTSPLETYDI